MKDAKRRKRLAPLLLFLIYISVLIIRPSKQKKKVSPLPRPKVGVLGSIYIVPNEELGLGN